MDNDVAWVTKRGRTIATIAIVLVQLPMIVLTLAITEVVTTGLFGPYATSRPQTFLAFVVCLFVFFIVAYLAMLATYAIAFALFRISGRDHWVDAVTNPEDDRKVLRRPARWIRNALRRLIAGR